MECVLYIWTTHTTRMARKAWNFGMAGESRQTSALWVHSPWQMWLLLSFQFTRASMHFALNYNYCWRKWVCGKGWKASAAKTEWSSKLVGNNPEPFSCNSTRDPLHAYISKAVDRPSLIFVPFEAPYSERMSWILSKSKWRRVCLSGWPILNHTPVQF